MAFDKEKFLSQNRKAQDNNPFSGLEDGFYIAELEDAKLGNAVTSGRYQASFIWELDQSESNYDKKIGQHIGLDNEQGYEIINYVLLGLGASHSQLTTEFAENPEGFLQRCIGTKARLQLLTKDNFQNVRIKKLIHSTIKDGAAAAVNTQAAQTNVSAPELQTNTQTQQTPQQEQKVQVGPGLPVLVNGRKATVVAINEQLNQAYVKFEDNGASELVTPDIMQVDMERYGKTQSAAPIVVTHPNTQITQPTQQIQQPVEDIVEEVAEKPPLKIEVGMQVNGIYNGKNVTGTVHAIDGDTIKIAALDLDNPTSGKKKAYPCSRESVIANTPF